MSLPDSKTLPIKIIGIRAPGKRAVSPIILKYAAVEAMLKELKSANIGNK
tara:strand:- start:867 stop:1016 length:150 start_codon:yes stop_codon:yes gene_type:complete